MQIKLTQLLNELGINTPGRASIAQLKRWEAEIQASDDEMTQIKLAFKCAEGVMWIWREKHPTDNRPQAAINALKNYIKDPSAENAQNCEKAANAAYVDAAYAAANDAAANAAAAAAAAADAAAAAADAAAWAATYAITAIIRQKERQLN
jgi:hypothetical protein